MISIKERARLEEFISFLRETETSPLDRLWAGRCAALLNELELLEERVEELTRETDAALESQSSDTCII